MADPNDAAKKVEQVLEIDYLKNQETPLEDIVSELHNPIEEPVEEKKDDVTPVEEPKAEEKDEEIEFDPEAYKKQVRDEILAEAAKLVEKVTTKEEKQEVPELVAPWTKENRSPKDYEEVADWALEKQKVLNQREQEQSIKQKEAEQEAFKKSEQERIDGFNKFTDDQLEDLYTAGKLERGNEEQRKELFKTMLDVNIERQKIGKPPVYSIKEIYYENYKPPVKNEQPPGADAPIVGNGPSPAPETQEIDYVKDIQPGVNMTSWLTRMLGKKN